MPLSAGSAKSSVPFYQPDEDQHRRRIAEWANQVMGGKLNNVGTCTLTGGVASTSVVDARVGVNSFIGFTPTTANAASELGAGTMYLKSTMKGVFTIKHANSASADRTFDFCILG